jgi:hypothetical protein
MTTLTVRPACVVYYDLAWHPDVSKEEFWSYSQPKKMRIFGLTVEIDGLIKVLVEDDMDVNNECEGIVIPKGCVEEIIYFEESSDTINVPHLDGIKDHN